MIKVAIARLYTKNSYLDYNYENLCKLYNEAVKNSIDIVVFPRLALTGLNIKNSFLDKEFTDKYIDYLEKLTDLTIGNETKILVGGIYQEEKFFDSVFFIDNGYIDTISSRKEISKDNIFDDYNYFDKSPILEQVKYNKKKISILISDDIYSNFNVFLVSDNKPDYIFCFDTSTKDIEYRKKHLIKLAKFANSPVFYINNATVYNNKYLKGELILINEDFEIKHCDIYKKDELFSFEIDCDDGTELLINNKLKSNFDMNFLIDKEKVKVDKDSLKPEELKNIDKSKIIKFNNTILSKFIDKDLYKNLSEKAKDEIKGFLIKKL